MCTREASPAARETEDFIVQLFNTYSYCNLPIHKRHFPTTCKSLPLTITEEPAHPLLQAFHLSLVILLVRVFLRLVRLQLVAQHARLPHRATRVTRDDFTVWRERGWKAAAEALEVAALA